MVRKFIFLHACMHSFIHYLAGYCYAVKARLENEILLPQPSKKLPYMLLNCAGFKCNSSGFFTPTFQLSKLERINSETPSHLELSFFISLCYSRGNKVQFNGCKFAIQTTLALNLCQSYLRLPRADYMWEPPCIPLLSLLFLVCVCGGIHFVLVF